MISNKDVGFNKEKGELMINGEVHELASPESLDALAVDVGTNTTAITGLDARVTALEEGGANKPYIKLGTGTLNTTDAPGVYGRVNIDINDYDDFIVLVKKQSDTIYSIAYLNRVPIFSEGYEVKEGVFTFKRWNASDLRLGINCIEGGSINYVLFGR